MSGKVDLWLELCDRDLKGAYGMFETKNYVLAGFQCHQVAEKALKAYIVTVSDKEPPKTHNLPWLLELTGLENELSEEQLELLDRLNPLCIEARYAEYKSVILSRMTPEYCRELISKTEDFLLWIKNRLLR